LYNKEEQKQVFDFYSKYELNSFGKVVDASVGDAFPKLTRNINFNKPIYYNFKDTADTTFNLYRMGLELQNELVHHNLNPSSSGRKSAKIVDLKTEKKSYPDNLAWVTRSKLTGKAINGHVKVKFEHLNENNEILKTVECKTYLLETTPAYQQNDKGPIVVSFLEGPDPKDKAGKKRLLYPIPFNFPLTEDGIIDPEAKGFHEIVAYIIDPANDNVGIFDDFREDHTLTVTFEKVSSKEKGASVDKKYSIDDGVKNNLKPLETNETN